VAQGCAWKNIGDRGTLSTVSSSRSAGRTSDHADDLPPADEPARSRVEDSSDLSADERSQIASLLRLSPSERLRYLEDMIAFEERARRARRLT
jgi:hypothetical protein